ncbi:MAG: glycyl-radical enzyme activating protein [Odoribacteraceae bacterium]|jgi:pyruvate formate lyase activating enzyme|nr:glycyl-radical enzyme activating protein [Odoribacteraceae bacterium]
MKGFIFDIKRYAIHDGPGIRTTVFFKGCNLRCRWCHNPESQPAGETLMWQTLKVGEREHAGQRVVGYSLTVDELVARVTRDRIFYEESGGGVTFSGGEPLLQAEFLAECLARCREQHLHTCIDTAGAVRTNRLDEICRLADLFLYDLKSLNPRKFHAHVGEGLEIVKSNLEHVARVAKEVIIRVPVIPGVNMERGDTREIIDFLAGIPAIRRVQLLPYHRNGADKYTRLGKTYEMGDTPGLKQENVTGIKTWFQEAGYEVL